MKRRVWSLIWVRWGITLSPGWRAMWTNSGNWSYRARCQRQPCRNNTRGSKSSKQLWNKWNILLGILNIMWLKTQCSSSQLWSAEPCEIDISNISMSKTVATDQKQRKKNNKLKMTQKTQPELVTYIYINHGPLGPEDIVYWSFFPKLKSTEE